MRRPSAGILVLASAVGAWLAITDPSTGTGLLRVGGVRALYTSTTLAFTTAVPFAMLVSLLGFCTVSNALERDLRTRMATVVASAPVRNAEYLLGKLAGSVALFLMVTLGCMAAVMAMQTTATLVALLFAGVPALRLLASEPRAGVSAIVGVMFLATTSVALGIATGTPKTFVGLSLALWYLALNAKGHGSALDYGGWWASATPLTQVGWAAAGVMAAVAPMAAHRARTAREG